MDDSNDFLNVDIFCWDVDSKPVLDFSYVVKLLCIHVLGKLDEATIPSDLWVVSNIEEENQCFMSELPAIEGVKSLWSIDDVA